MSVVAPTDSELVDIAAQTYVRTDPFAESIDNAVRVFLTTLLSGVNIISFEGTKNIAGWLLDLFALDERVFPVAQLFTMLGVKDHPIIEHPQLGLVHAGFDAGVMSVMPKLALAAARGPFALTGHSLGAALALRACAEFVLDGTPPVKCACFAPPRVGGAKFVKAATSVPFCAYRYMQDPVTEVPFTLPAFPYEQIPLIQLSGIVLDDPFDYHHINNYVDAIRIGSGQ